MQVVVQDLLTSYESIGQGKTLLLLHGWGDSMRSFDTLVPELIRDYQVVRLDLPGFGQSEAPASIWDLDTYGAFVGNFLAKLQIENVYAVIGHSNGGALAIRSVATGKLTPQKLILLAASGVRDTQKLRRAGLKVVAKTGKVMTFWLPKPTKQKLQKKLYGTIGSDMLVAPHLQETFKHTVRQDIQRDAMKITIPTLLIYGEQDRATPLESVGKQLNTRIAGSYLKIIPGADHFVHQMATEEVAQDIKEFLKK